MCRARGLGLTRGEFFLTEDSFEACDFATHFGEFVGMLYLSGLFAQAEVNLGVTGITQLFQFLLLTFRVYLWCSLEGLVRFLDIDAFTLPHGRRSGNGKEVWYRRGAGLREPR